MTKAKGYRLNPRNKKKEKPVRLPIPTKLAKQKTLHYKSTAVNYELLGIVHNPNKTLDTKRTEDIDIETPNKHNIPAQPDKEMTDLLAIPAPPPEAPKTLGFKERWTWKKLFDKYGDNYKAMTRDIKLNPNQYTAKQCQKKIKIYLQTYKTLCDKIEQQRIEREQQEQQQQNKT
uniref:Nucleolar protein 16 n=1 Tax=Arcella intermedia TaxID=1963864 RepID=A0A6B2LLM1_9EUKA